MKSPFMCKYKKTKQTRPKQRHVALDFTGKHNYRRRTRVLFAKTVYLVFKLVADKKTQLIRAGLEE